VASKGPVARLTVGDLLGEEAERDPDEVTRERESGLAVVLMCACFLLVLGGDCRCDRDEDWHQAPGGRCGAKVLGIAFLRAGVVSVVVWGVSFPA